MISLGWALVDLPTMVLLAIDPIIRVTMSWIVVYLPAVEIVVLGAVAPAAVNLYAMYIVYLSRVDLTSSGYPGSHGSGPCESYWVV